MLAREVDFGQLDNVSFRIFIYIIIAKAKERCFPSSVNESIKGCSIHQINLFWMALTSIDQHSNLYFYFCIMKKLNSRSALDHRLSIRQLWLSVFYLRFPSFKFSKAIVKENKLVAIFSKHRQPSRESALRCFLSNPWKAIWVVLTFFLRKI